MEGLVICQWSNRLNCRLNIKFSTRCFKVLESTRLFTHTLTQEHTRTHTRTQGPHKTENQKILIKVKKKKRQPRHWKEQSTGFLKICGLESNSVEMGRVSTLLTADPRVLSVCFQCLLDGWLCPRHCRLSTFIKACMQKGERTRWWALCMYEAFSVDVGHARRCTQEDYLILIHATWYNVIKHLTWEISSILIQERTGGN